MLPNCHHRVEGECLLSEQLCCGAQCLRVVLQLSLIRAFLDPIGLIPGELADTRLHEAFHRIPLADAAQPARRVVWFVGRCGRRRACNRASPRKHGDEPTPTLHHSSVGPERKPRCVCPRCCSHETSRCVCTRCCLHGSSHLHGAAARRPMRTHCWLIRRKLLERPVPLPLLQRAAAPGALYIAQHSGHRVVVKRCLSDRPVPRAPVIRAAMKSFELSVELKLSVLQTPCAHLQRFDIKQWHRREEALATTCPELIQCARWQLLLILHPGCIHTRMHSGARHSQVGKHRHRRWPAAEIRGGVAQRVVHPLHLTAEYLWLRARRAHDHRIRQLLGARWELVRRGVRRGVRSQPLQCLLKQRCRSWSKRHILDMDNWHCKRDFLREDVDGKGMAEPRLPADYARRGAERPRESHGRAERAPEEVAAA